VATISGLHLQYRLWIADINSDITVLRILNDYMIDKSAKNKDADTVQRISYFKEAFSKLRKEMDELRHEMHLNKMKLASLVKDPGQSINTIEDSINHTALKERYEAFRGSFNNTKKEYQDFENA
jgi:chromosome segregation ATPase